MNPKTDDFDAPMALPFAIQIVREETTDGGMCFTATHAELPGCMAHGGTMTEAVENLVEARRLYIQGLIRRGLPVPPPPSVSGAP